MIKPDNLLDMDEVFGDGGPISRFYSAFESRPEQLKMAAAVERAVFARKRLAVEAGTGVGKSFAYLIPAVKAVNSGLGRILVSTYTITLQEQLINKDLPFLEKCLPNKFTAVLAKGRGNYLCKRRLEFALRRQGRLFDQILDELNQIDQWALKTKDGSLSDLPFVPAAGTWDVVRSEHGNCMGKKCSRFGDCFYRLARRKLETADIIVANHALMFSDLTLKMNESFSLLPSYKNIIIDEAHNIEAVAQDNFGIDISDRTVKYLLDWLYNPTTYRGLLAGVKNSDAAIELIGKIKKESGKFFRKVKQWYQANIQINGGRCHKNFVDDNLSEYLRRLQTELSGLSNLTGDVDEKFELIRYVNKCAILVKELDSFISQEKAEYVYWIEYSGSQRSAVRLKSAPLNVGPDVKRCLFDKFKSVVLTSATLSSDGKDEKSGFDFFAARTGLEDFEGLKIGSPFDYKKQVTIYIEKDLPDPNEKGFVDVAVKTIKEYILQTGARAFVLFTSYSMLTEMADKISDWLGEKGIDLLQQGGGLDRAELLRRFRNQGKSVLFGTDSFWQGVDVPGEALSNVIIVKLPFGVPTQPLLAGRLEQIKQQGGNPFLDYQIPSAIIKFKQGFGRLIRSKKDKGIVVILDSRITNKRYGGRFLQAIPKCKVEIISRIL